MLPLSFPSQILGDWYLETNVLTHGNMQKCLYTRRTQTDFQLSVCGNYCITDRVMNSQPETLFCGEIWCGEQDSVT